MFCLNVVIYNNDYVFNVKLISFTAKMSYGCVTFLNLTILDLVSFAHFFYYYITLIFKNISISLVLIIVIF